VFDSGDVQEQQLKSAKEDAEDFAETLRTKVFKGKQIQTQVKVEYGDAGISICETAEQEGCSLIVVGSHKKSSLQTLFMGSVSNYVLHHSEIPVVVIRM
jgi:nucleotide-binding universal stress UspA family protein